MNRIVVFIATCGFLVFLFHPYRHSAYYTSLATVDTFNELFVNPIEKGGPLPKCPARFYKQLVRTREEIDILSVNNVRDFLSPSVGGKYTPNHCISLFSVALIIPYRNREEQLRTFLNYMHSFLQKQHLHYRIFVVEQNNTLPFNRALMLNIGALEAMNLNYSCLILHDVDLLPLNRQNIYACFKRPRHMSTSVDTLRYNLPYLKLCGGALGIRSSQFRRINGMSNVFYGWGGEDDDLFTRLQRHDLIPYRLSPEVSVYTMMRHRKAAPSETIAESLEYAVDRHKSDGLNSVTKNYKVQLKLLYTHIVVF